MSGLPDAGRLARGPVGRLLLGDWHPLLRDPIDLLRLSFLVGALVMAATGNLAGALRLAGTFVLVVIARWIAPPRLFDLGFVVAQVLQGWGNVFDGFERFNWYDEVVHLLLSGFTAPLWYLLLIRLDVVPDLERSPRSRSSIGIVVVTFALGFSFGALYEIYEYVVVNWLGADLGIGYGDTIGDMSANAVASLLGGLLLMAWARSGTGTRRVPRDQLADERA